MRLVKYAKLHGTVHLPGVGDLGSTLPPGQKTLDMKMILRNDGGIDLRVKGLKASQQAPLGEMSAFIPSANIQIASYVEVDDEKQEAKPHVVVKAPGGLASQEAIIAALEKAKPAEAK